VSFTVVHALPFFGRLRRGAKSIRRLSADFYKETRHHGSVLRDYRAFGASSARLRASKSTSTARASSWGYVGMTVPLSLRRDARRGADRHSLPVLSREPGSQEARQAAPRCGLGRRSTLPPQKPRRNGNRTEASLSGPSAGRTAGPNILARLPATVEANTPWFSNDRTGPSTGIGR
jgi:hypothetical protein